jgi:hypothetical protein
MSRFLVAASFLSIASLAQAANWLPSSPLVQIGDDLDIFFDSAVALEVTDNLFSGSAKKAATDWSVTPGFTLEYGKDSAFSVNLSAKRSYVYFNQAEFAGLQDSRDALTGAIRFADGGPLVLTLDSSYRVTARNDDLVQAGVSVANLGATLVRQANYSHAFKANYKLTEKFKLGLGYTNTYNHYINPTSEVVNSVTVYNTNGLTELNTKSIPLDIDYQAFEKLSFGIALSHDTTDYSAAPYFNSAGTPRQALIHKQMQKDVAGLTAKGQLTESGKLNGVIRVGYSRYNYDGGAYSNDPSYSISLSHALTERLSHSLTVSRDVTASSSNGQSKTQSYVYGVAFSAAEDLSFNLSVNKTDVLSDATKVNTMIYTLGADYKYSAFLSFQAGYNFTDSKTPSIPASSYNSNTFTLSAAFRY